VNPGCTQQAATYCCKWEETCDASRIVTGPLWKSPHTCFASHMTQNTIRTHSFHVMYCVSCCHLLHAKPETTHVVSTLDCVCKLCHVSTVLRIKQCLLCSLGLTGSPQTLTKPCTIPCMLYAATQMQLGQAVVHAVYMHRDDIVYVGSTLCC